MYFCISKWKVILMDRKTNIFGHSLTRLLALVSENGWPSYSARQIASWLYKHHVNDFDQMSNLSKIIRKELSRVYTIECRQPLREQISVDGTKKYLFRAGENGYVESAYIPEVKRHTLCLSSQVGCRMGCSFCMTARMGFKAQLSPGEILNQFRSIPEHKQITNIVYMGMGEPLDNLEAVLQSLEILTAEWGYGMSPRRITVSTIGIVPALNIFLEKSKCNLAVSLHSPFEEERKMLVPLSKKHPLKKILDTIQSFPIEKQRRISFEYIVFKDLNHSNHHVKALAAALNRIRCRINLLSFHAIPGSTLKPPSNADLELFKDQLEAKGITTTIRRSRGLDIAAACGLLSTISK